MSQLPGKDGSYGLGPRGEIQFFPFEPVQRARKQCSGCGALKPLEEYARDGSRSDGRCHRCKECKRRDYEEREAELEVLRREAYPSGPGDETTGSACWSMTSRGKTR